MGSVYSLRVAGIRRTLRFIRSTFHASLSSVARSARWRACVRACVLRVLTLWEGKNCFATMAANPVITHLFFFLFFFRGVRAGVPFYRGMFAPLTITSVFLREAGWFCVQLALC